MASYVSLAEHLRANVASPKTGVPIPDTWKQGRTAYGGLTAGLSVEAARAGVPDLPALRSLQVNFAGPVTGDPMFGTRLLRRGRNVASVAVEARVGGDTVALAQCVFGQARESSVVEDPPAPDGPGWREAEPFFPPNMPEGADAFVPAFLRNFEVRLVAGSRPMTGAERGHVRVWARHGSEASRTGESAFVCLGDVLPPAAFAVMRRPAPVSSVNWTLNLLRSTDTEDGWYLVETEQTAARDGYSSQRMRYWNSAGEMVAEGMQAVAVFA